MGQFKFEMVAVGGHGCDRTARDGEKFRTGCGRESCPDCSIGQLVEQLRKVGNGCTIESAVLTHWPGTSSVVKDDFVSGTRRGNFG